MRRVAEKGKVLARKLAALVGVQDHVRGRGFMLGLVLTDALAKGAVAAGYERGVILNAPQKDVLPAGATAGAHRCGDPARRRACRRLPARRRRRSRLKPDTSPVPRLL